MRSGTIALLIGGSAVFLMGAVTSGEPATTQPEAATTRPAHHQMDHAQGMRPHPTGQGAPRWDGERGRPPAFGRRMGPPPRMQDRRDDREDLKSSRHEDDDVEELTEQVKKLRRQISELQDTVDDMARHDRKADKQDGHRKHRHDDED